MIRTVQTGKPPAVTYGATCTFCGAVIEADLEDLGKTTLCPTPGCVEILYVRIGGDWRNVTKALEFSRKMVRDNGEKRNV